MRIFKFCFKTTSTAIFLLLALIFFTHCATTRFTHAPKELRQPLTQFRNYLIQLKKELQIPALSVAIVQKSTIIWAEGFGMLDTKNEIPVTPKSYYKIGSLTKTITSALLIKLQEKKVLSFSQTMRPLAPKIFTDKKTTLLNVITHTAESSGSRFRYRPDLFFHLTKAIEKTTRKKISDLFKKMIFAPAKMRATFKATTHAHKHALPHTWDKQTKTSHAGHPSDHQPNAAYGLSASVLDLANFMKALYSNDLLSKKSQITMLTKTKNIKGKPLPVGLGWFINQYLGYTVAWNYGLQPNKYSAFLLTIPEKKLSLILLANNENLTAPFLPGYASLCGYPQAKKFLELFITKKKRKQPKQSKQKKSTIFKKGLIAKALLANFHNRKKEHNILMQRLFTLFPPKQYSHHSGIVHHCSLSSDPILQKNAIIIGEKLLAKKTNNPYILLDLAILYIKSGKESHKRTALSYLHQAIKFDKSQKNWISIWSLYHLALLYSHHKPQKAQRYLKQAIKIAKEDPATTNILNKTLNSLQ